MIPDTDYYALVSSSNRKQTKFFYYILGRVKNHSDVPFHTYLGGGGGVGKIAVTNALYQMLLSVLNKILGANPDEIKNIVRRSNW